MVLRVSEAGLVSLEAPDGPMGFTHAKQVFGEAFQDVMDGRNVCVYSIPLEWRALAILLSLFGWIIPELSSSWRVS